MSDDINSFISSLHERVDNLEKDFEYIDREVSKNSDLRNEGHSIVIGVTSCPSNPRS